MLVSSLSTCWCAPTPIWVSSSWGGGMSTTFTAIALVPCKTYGTCLLNLCNLSDNKESVCLEVYMCFGPVWRNRKTPHHDNFISWGHLSLNSGYLSIWDKNQSSPMVSITVLKKIRLRSVCLQSLKLLKYLVSPMHLSGLRASFATYCCMQPSLYAWVVSSVQLARFTH